MRNRGKTTCKVTRPTAQAKLLPVSSFRKKSRKAPWCRIGLHSRGMLQHTLRWRAMEGQEMDWKRLVQFVLSGDSGLEQYAILLVRVAIGLFFAISGGNKLFVAGGTKPVYDTLVKAKVPFPRQTAYFVAGVEFVGGSLVTVGFLSSPASAALMIDMIVATITSAVSTLPQ